MMPPELMPRRTTVPMILTMSLAVTKARMRLLLRLPGTVINLSYTLFHSSTSPSHASVSTALLPFNLHATLTLSCPSRTRTLILTLRSHFLPPNPYGSLSPFYPSPLSFTTLTPYPPLSLFPPPLPLNTHTHTKTARRPNHLYPSPSPNPPSTLTLTRHCSDEARVSKVFSQPPQFSCSSLTRPPRSPRRSANHIVANHS